MADDQTPSPSALRRSESQTPLRRKCSSPSGSSDGPIPLIPYPTRLRNERTSSSPFSSPTTPRSIRRKYPRTPGSISSGGLGDWYYRSSGPASPSYGDRFIPNREAMNPQVLLHLATNENPDRSPPEALADGEGQATPSREFNSKLAQSLFDLPGPSIGKALAFSNKTPQPRDIFQETLRGQYQSNRQSQQKVRHIALTPERILDAPDLMDDYYLNLLDWSSQNILAVGLGATLYLWNATTSAIEVLYENSESGNFVSSVRWMADGSHLAVGCSDKVVRIFDVQKKEVVRSMKGHRGRVSALAWNKYILSSGSRDTLVFNHDVRAANHHVASLTGHTEEICGLQWSPDGTQLASGGNDNVCCVWDRHATTPRFTFPQHSAAVKALAWCPFQRQLLATGAGTADRHIRFFNTANGQCVRSIDTGSQVCSLQWSKTERELLSSHGFSQNQLTVWKYPSLTPLATLTGHTSRVLHTAVSPDGAVVCSAAADETLRFWTVWDPVSEGPKQGLPSRNHDLSFAAGLARSIR